MEINREIFRAYDIRGIYGTQLSREAAVQIGAAFGTILRRKGLENPKVVVGRDNRFSSDELSVKLIDGLLSAGCAVTDIGLSVTPFIHFSTTNFDFDAGIIVTASHNPKEFNGFRFELKNCTPFYNDSIQELYRIIEAENFISGIGSVSYRENVFDDYLSFIKSRIIIGRRLKVVLDCANASASKFAPKIFTALGCEVVGLFCSLDGDYPYHQPDPEERVNLQTLRLKVLEEKADLGFGFDTDADRFGVVDEKGVSYENDKILVVLARDILKRFPGRKVAFDVKSSYVLPSEIKKSGGVPLMIKTGHPYFREAMMADDNLILAGEVSSHTFIKDGYFGYDDGLYAAVRVAQLLSLAKHPFSEFFSDIPHTAHTEEIKLPCPDEKKFSIVEEVGSILCDNFETVKIDGFRIIVSSTAWFLIRASNTGPYISLRLEAESEEHLHQLIDLVRGHLEKYPEVDTQSLMGTFREKKEHLD